MTDGLTPEQIARWSARTFRKLDKELFPALQAVLRNDDGIARILAITDEEWQAAVDAESPENGA